MNEILTSIAAESDVVALLDERLVLPDNLSPELKIRRVMPSLLQRLRAEWWLARNAAHSDFVLCFGNLPPLFRLRGTTVVFLQNRYLVDDIALDALSFKTRLRLHIERYWLRAKMLNASEFIVQTPSMKKLLEPIVQGSVRVRMLPFISNQTIYPRRIHLSATQGRKEFTFLYVASGEAHKNHKTLIEAWCFLAQIGEFPLLKLTIDPSCFPDLCMWIESCVRQYHLNVQNIGNLPYTDVQKLYSCVDALIFPSAFESFGLPLIEARQAGLPVLAPELDYVRDVLDPEQSFDPTSAVSISRAVQRFMGIDENPLPLNDASSFLRRLSEKSC